MALTPLQRAAQKEREERIKSYENYSSPAKGSSVEEEKLTPLQRAAKQEREARENRQQTQNYRANDSLVVTRDGGKSVSAHMAEMPSAKMEDDPSFFERLGYGAKSILERTKATPDLLYQGIKGAIADSDNEELQKAEARRMAMEKLARQMDIGYHNEGVLAPGGEAVTQADIIAAGVENAQKRENELMSKIDPDSYGYKTYTKGVEAQEKATAGLGKFGKFIADTLISVGDNASVMPLAMIPGVGSAATLGAMSAKASAGRAYELTREGKGAREALTRGLLSGGIEALTEKIPLDNLLDAVKVGGTPFVSTALKQMGTEASEETASYILNYISDYTTGDPNASFSLGELMESALAGALSGGIMGGGASLVNRALNRTPAEVTAPAEPAETPIAEKGVLSHSDGISDEEVKLVSEEKIVAQHPQVNSDDVVMEFARETVAKRQDAAEENIRKVTADYGEQGVKAIGEIAESTGRAVEDVQRDFDAAYKTGYSQIARERAAVANDIQERAYTAGYLDRTTKIEQNRAKQEIVRKEGGLLPDDYDLYSKLDSNTQSVLDKLGKATGAVIIIDNEMPAMADGYYDNGEVHIAPDTDKPAVQVFRHEFTHRMQDIGTKEYASFHKYVQTYMQNKGIVYKTADLYNRNNVQLSEKGVMDEVVSQFAEAILTDEKTMSDFVNKITSDPQTRTWRQKVIEVIRDLFGKLKSVLAKATDEEKATMKQFGLTLQQVRKAEKLWMDAAKASVAESRQTPNMRSKESSGIKHSIKSLAQAAGIDAVRNPETSQIEFYIDGKPVKRITAKHIEENSGLGALIKLAHSEGNITAEDMQQQFKAAADIMNMILETQDPEMVWAYVGSSMFSALKSNADAQYGTTIDFTTVCRKTQDMITAMSHAMVKLGRGLTKDEVTQLQADLFAEGSEVPCPVCYVFSRWAGIGSILDNMNKWQTKYDKYTPAQLQKRIDDLTEKLGKGKAKDLKQMLREQDAEYDELNLEKERHEHDKRQLTKSKKVAVKENDAQRLLEINKQLDAIAERMPQINKRLNEIKSSVAPELSWLINVRAAPDYVQRGKVPTNILFNLNDAASFAESYPLAWKYRTSRGPSAGKAILPYSDMRLGDAILGVDNNSASGNTIFSNVKGNFTKEQKSFITKAIQRTKAQNLIGGQRFQSTSDFRYDYALDYIQAFFEYQALGSKLQTYTKIIEFADMVAAVGGDVNLSVMPKNKGYVTLPNGTNQLVYSSVTGINYEAAKRANEMHDNVQLILVGINDTHILAALEDSTETGGAYIGFVIPYHASGASINEFIRVLVSNLGETFNIKYYQDYSDVQADKERKNATAEQKRRHDLRAKILKGKDGSQNWTPTSEDIEFMRGTSADISNRSFAELRAIEKKALKGDAAAIEEYSSWTAGNLWNIYNRLWVNETDIDYGVRLNTNQAKAIMPHEYWNKTVNRDKAYINGFLFRSYCYNLGLTPRFSGVVVKGEKHGDFTDSTGYWKTLIDRPMYRNDGTYRDQQKINVTSFQKEMLTADYAERNWAGYAVTEPNTIRATRAAEKFIARESGKVRQYSLKDSEGNALSKEQQEFFADSKMRDAAGKLAVAYHGTDADFTTFRKSAGQQGKYGAYGIYFADRETASGYGNTKQYYLNAKNVLAVDANGNKATSIFTDVVSKGRRGLGEFTHIDDIAAFADENGYDGVIVQNVRDNYNNDETDHISNVYIVFEPEQIKLTSNKNPTSDTDIRYSLKEDSESKPYSRTAVLTEETIDKYLHDYASKGSPNYAQAYIAQMSPKTFLNLTTSLMGKYQIMNESRPLNMEEFADATKDVPLQLRINTETGEILGHEGRHRSVALMDAGVHRIPVLLFDPANKYSKERIPEIVLKGQDFGSSKSWEIAGVKDLIPFNYANRDEIIRKFTQLPSDERIGEKYGLRNTVRYSLKASNGFKLTEAQAEYFKDSKVRDENGNLLVMYHGTSNGVFTAFDTYGGKFGLFGMGSYFTDNPQVALSYTEKGKGKTPRIYSVFLNIKNPLDMDAPADVDKWRTAFKNADLDPSYLNDIETNEDAFKALKENLMDDYYERYEAEELVTEMILGMGYDGITHIGGGRFNKKDDTRHRVYIAFEPEQIKDTNNENPTTNADIRYSIRGSDDVRKAIIKARQAGRRKGLSQKQIDTNVRNIVTNAYAGFNQEYGSIEMGEKPSRMVNVPLQTGEGEYVSRTIRTALEAGATPDVMIPTIEQMVTTGDFSYDRYTDEAAMEKAEKTIKHKGDDIAFAEWMADVSKNNVTKDNVAMGWTLYNAAANAGDTKKAITILTKMVGQVRNAAQALQATRILKKLSPSAQLYGVQRSIEHLQEELIKKYGDKAPNLEIDEDLAKKFLEAKTEEERAEAMQDLYKDIGRQIPASWLDKWNAWRYLAMLGNARTHVRNIAGNAFFAPVVLGKNTLSTMGEQFAQFATGGKVQANKALPNRALFKAAWSDYANVADAIDAGGKYSDAAMQNKAIEEGRIIFKNKFLETARKKNSEWLGTEDVWFAQPHYALALAQYCKAHGITADEIERGIALDPARAYAMKEAMKATYKDVNWFSDLASKVGKYKGDNPGMKALSVLAEGVLPFRKTPANILARGVEYSPVGIMKSIYDGIVNVKNGKMTAADVIDELSAGLTGTGLLVLGAMLASRGLIRGSGGDDEEKKKFAELQGHQEYSLILGNKSYTIDWLAPEALPFLVGVNIAETAIANEDGLKMSDILSAASNITQPMLDLSCLQSLNDLIDSVGYASSTDTSGIVSMAASAATSYLTQGLPTLFGQFERTSESERMTTYTTKDAFLTPDMQYAIGKASAKIPGVDYGQIPYIDAWGRTEASGLITDRALKNLIKPYYESTLESSAMEQELEHLYEIEGDAGILPDRADKKIIVDKKNVYLTAEQYVKYATTKGQLSYDMLTKLTADAEYKKLSNTDKVSRIKRVYELTNAIAKMQVSDYKPDGWIAKAINAAKTTGIDYYKYLQVYEQNKIATAEENRLQIDGTTITNSASLQTMEVLYASKLNDKQRKQLMEDFGVGKKVREYSPALVKEKLAEMRGKAD